jgi:hypothetical protein
MALSFPGSPVLNQIYEAEGTRFRWDGALWLIVGTAASPYGDMDASVYDPTNIIDDAFDRGNHTGTQLAATISDFSSAVAATAAVTANTAKVTNATHTGDVTGATALTIANGVVTLAKQADVATATVFYRTTAGAGAPEVQPLATLKTDLGLTGTNSGDQTITLTGEVTGTGTGSFATTITADSVTNVKLDNMATQTIKGRTTAGTGDPEDLTPAQTRTILNVADGATANASDAALRDRSTHTGTQLAATISDFAATVAANAAVVLNTAKVTNATHTGEVTGATALTITNGVVTLAKLADLATNTIIGRATAGTGVPEALSASQVRTILGLATIATSGSATDLITGTLPAARFDDTAHGARTGGSLHADVVAAGASGFMTGADKTKLDGVATGATANSSDAFLLARANHTGTQLAVTISDFDAAVAANSAVAANTAKVTNATHTGDVTGATVLTIANNAVTTVKILDDAVTSAKILDGAVNYNKIANGAVSDIKLADNGISNAKLLDVATATFKGRVTAGTGDVEDLTTAQATSLLDLFSSTLKGLVPPGGAGSTTFLRQDGVWTLPTAGAATLNVQDEGITLSTTPIKFNFVGTGVTVTEPVTDEILITIEAPRSGTASLDFGAAPGSSIAELIITGQTGILATSNIKLWIQADSTVDHNEYEHTRILAGRVNLAAADVSAGTGFTIIAESEMRLTGLVKCRWEWS